MSCLYDWECASNGPLHELSEYISRLNTIVSTTFKHYNPKDIFI